MNDTELDELLNTWKTPPVRPSWRESVQNRIARKNRRPLRELLPRWRWLVAGTSTAAIILLLSNTSAFSRKLNPPPYTVDSEIRWYLGENVAADNSADVSPSMTLLVTSYNQAGTEVVTSVSFPNQTLKSVVGNIFLTFWDAANGFKRHFMPSEDAGAFAIVDPSAPRETLVVGRRDAIMNSGCQLSDGGAKVLGREVILDYSVISIQQPHRHRPETQIVTLWMAPELNCFALRATTHTKQPDGTWKLLSEKQALKVTVNR